eukprot:4304404-Prymnesium_polylepis.1
MRHQRDEPDVHHGKGLAARERVHLPAHVARPLLGREARQRLDARVVELLDVDLHDLRSPRPDA